MARQYWRDLDSLEVWTRSAPHRDWWQRSLHHSGGTGFWHEAYFARGAIDDMDTSTGLARFAPVIASRGRAFSTRGRVEDKPAKVAPVVPESALYDSESAGSGLVIRPGASPAPLATFLAAQRTR